MSFINRGPGGKLAKIKGAGASRATSTSSGRRMPGNLGGGHEGPPVTSRYAVHQHVRGRCPEDRSGVSCGLGQGRQYVDAARGRTRRVAGRGGYCALMDVSMLVRGGGAISAFAGHLGVPSFGVGRPLSAKANGKRSGGVEAYRDHDVPNASEG